MREQTPREVRFTGDLRLGMRCRRAKGKCDELGLWPPKVEELDGEFFRVTFYRRRDDDECVDLLTLEVFYEISLYLRTIASYSAACASWDSTILNCVWHRTRLWSA